MLSPSSKLGTAFKAVLSVLALIPCASFGLTTELLDAVPQSPMSTLGGNWSASINTSFSSSGSGWATTFPESDVFQASLFHNQLSGGNPIASRSFEARIGKGGQLFSMTSAFGESVPPQWRGTNSHPAPWVDEVFQVVATNTSLANATSDKYFVHQAGVYLNETGMEPFYSPTLASGSGTDPHAYVTVNWGQQAHVPSPYQSGIIYYTQYRDIGAGIMEITYLVYNGGTEDLNWFNLPWGGVRRTQLQEIELGDLGYESSIPFFSAGAKEDFDDMGGWMLFSSTASSGSNSLGVVMGVDKSPLPSWQNQASFLRYGNNGGSTKTTETDWRNYLVTSFIRPIFLEPGYCLESRIYMVVGSANAVKTQITSHDLVSNAGYDVYFNYAGLTPKLYWYKDSNGNPTTEAQAGQNSFYWTYRDPVRNNGNDTASKAVFWVENVATGQQYQTTDPYALCTYVENGKTVYRPYDGETKYLGFLGYRF